MKLEYMSAICVPFEWSLCKVMEIFTKEIQSELESLVRVQSALECLFLVLYRVDRDKITRSENSIFSVTEKSDVGLFENKSFADKNDII